jgi:hypothetical protein
MADYYTNFSLVLNLKDAAQQEYALDLAAKADRHCSEDEPLPSDFPESLAEVMEDWHFETEKDGDGIWLHSMYGGIDAVCAFIQHLLQKFDPKTCVKFEWSHDCNKPLVDAYGGGAAVITAKEIKTMNTSQWLDSVTYAV